MNRPKILIVDDEENIRVALERWFISRGFDVHVAGDGLEALEQCRENTYHVITMDLDMPRMSGLEAIPHIKGIHPEVPIIILTGLARETAGAIEKGVARVLTKPLRMKELEGHVRDLIQEPG
jgi:CheY-like chemotaxis protein